MIVIDLNLFDYDCDKTALCWRRLPVVRSLHDHSPRVVLDDLGVSEPIHYALERSRDIVLIHRTR